MPPRAVVFDLFGTLIDDTPPEAYRALLADIAGHLGADPDQFRAAWSQHDISRYTEPIEDAFGAMCIDLGVGDRAGIDAALAFRREHLRKLLVPRPDALSTVQALRDRGLKVDRRLYERMAELLAVSTEECVFVGDGAYRELQGAEAAGMTPVLIKAPHDEWEHEGTVGWDGPRVSSLSEVLALV
jgi:putative hydrolase of the HAD superfamily